MADIPGSIPITGFIAPRDDADEYPVFEDVYGKGGFRTVDTLINMNAISSFRKSEGMLVYCQEDETIYIWRSSAWETYLSKTPKADGVGDKYFAFDGTGTTWNITHNMGKYPSVTVVDNSLTKIEGDVGYVDDNSLQITFNTSVTGKAYLS